MTEKEVIEFDLKCLRNVMNNFEDGLCEKMQEKVDNIKNYLEQKDKEISELKEDNQHQWDERCKLTFAYDKDTHTLQNQLDVANADRVEKDKIIKAMAKYINSTDKDEDVCRETGDTFNCAEYRNCEECIIEFFKKKARKENE